VAKCPTGAHRATEAGHLLYRPSCIACGACVSPLCTALALAGEESDADRILEEVLKDRAYYEKTGGGMTLSGGEPLTQSAFSAYLLKRAAEQGIHTCVETCGCASERDLQAVAEYTDLFLFDLKETDPERHLAYTGAPLSAVLASLSLLDRMEKPTLLRCPIIPTLNDREEHFRSIAAIAEAHACVKEIVIEPYHTLGVGKYSRLGRAYGAEEIPEPQGEQVERWCALLSEHTAVKVSRAD
jgi:pyruvate formate lyase activating enzyme